MASTRLRLLEERLPVDLVEQAQRADRPLDAGAGIEREHSRRPRRLRPARPRRPERRAGEELQQVRSTDARSIVGSAQSSAIVSGDTSWYASTKRCTAPRSSSSRLLGDERARQRVDPQPPFRRAPTRAAEGGARSRAGAPRRPAARRGGSSSSCRETTRRPSAASDVARQCVAARCFRACSSARVTGDDSMKRATARSSRSSSRWVSASARASASRADLAAFSRRCAASRRCCRGRHTASGG